MTDRTRTFTWEDPMLGAEAAKTMSGLEYLEALMDRKLPAPPISATLNFWPIEFAPGRAVFVCDPAEYHYNPIGMVHGGLAATLFDSALGCAIQTQLPAGAGYSTLELHVNYVRPITAKTGRIRCEGEVVHLGHTVATAQARLIDEERGRLYGHATTTCMIFPAPRHPKASDK